MQDAPTTMVALGGLVVTLAGALVWVIHQVLGKTLPEQQAAHFREVEKVCESFRRDGEENRQLMLRLHGDMLDRLRELTGAIERGLNGKHGG